MKTETRYCGLCGQSQRAHDDRVCQGVRLSMSRIFRPTTKRQKPPFDINEFMFKSILAFLGVAAVVGVGAVGWYFFR